MQLRECMDIGLFDKFNFSNYFLNTNSDSPVQIPESSLTNITS